MLAVRAGSRSHIPVEEELLALKYCKMTVSLARISCEAVLAH